MRTSISIIVIFCLIIYGFGIGSVCQAVVSHKSMKNFVTDPENGLIYSDYLVRMDNITKIIFLRYSQSNMVVIGKDGWLYVDADDSMADYRGLVPYSGSHLSYILNIVKSERDYLRARGIPLLLVVAPNKESVYPEYLPDSIKKLGTETRLDQIEAYFKSNSDIQILDLRQVLIEAKNDKQVYRKTDSHWNSYGAYLAYCEIMKAIGLKPHPLKDYDEMVDTHTIGDLGQLLKMSDIYSEPVVHYRLKDGVISDKLPCAVIFHDSFYMATDLKPLMAPHFERIVDVRFGQLSLLSSQLIEQEKPDVVIYIMVERVVGQYFIPWQ